MTYLSVLKTSAPYHLLTYSLLFGATAYQSFYSGVVSFKALDYPNFSKLQAAIFPNYFRFQLAASLVLLAFPWTRAGRVGVWSAGIAAGGAAANVFWLGPLNARLSLKRMNQIEIEGKSHKDPSASDEMKAINKEFGSAHGKSVAINMGVFLSLLNYGVWASSKLRR